VHRDVLAAEEEKARVQQEIAALSERLKGLDTALAGRLQARVEYDRTIRETEIAYAKICESSSTLLRMLRREATHLAQGQGQGQGQRQQQQQQVAKGWEQYSYPQTGGGGVRRGVE
jgi:Sjoegren syndrome nuclear autoantigen 1